MRDKMSGRYNSVMKIKIPLLACLMVLTGCATHRPVNTAAYLNRGYAEFNKGDMNGAIADYTKAIQLKPNDPGAYYNRGYLEFDKGDWTDAISDYSRAIALKPDWSEPYNNRGSAKQSKGDLDGAIVDYTKGACINNFLQVGGTNTECANTISVAV
jgi:tetratricopeptide (TPR) repeat protein